jgi:hypothetical protein
LYDCTAAAVTRFAAESIRTENVDWPLAITDLSLADDVSARDRNHASMVWSGIARGELPPASDAGWLTRNLPGQLLRDSPNRLNFRRIAGGRGTSVNRVGYFENIRIIVDGCPPDWLFWPVSKARIAS